MAPGQPSTPTYAWPVTAGILSVLFLLLITMAAGLPDRALHVSALDGPLCSNGSSATGYVAVARVQAAGPVNVKLTQVTLDGTPTGARIEPDAGAEPNPPTAEATRDTTLQETPHALLATGQSATLYVALPDHDTPELRNTLNATITVHYNAYWTTRSASLPVTLDASPTCTPVDHP